MREYSFRFYKNGSEVDNQFNYLDQMITAIDFANCRMREINADECRIYSGEDFEDYITIKA